MSNEAFPLTRANYGFDRGPQVLARYGLVDFFALLPNFAAMWKVLPERFEFVVFPRREDKGRP